MVKTDLISRYMRFLRSSVDMIDWGYRVGSDKPLRKHEEEYLWACLEGHRKPSSFTRNGAAQHLAGEQTYYYVSSRRADTMLLMIDVDAHDGQTDAWDVVEFLTHAGGPFADQYVEQSTNGEGYHIYARLRCPGTRFRFNAKLNVLEDALGVLLDENNFESNIEVHGTYSLLEYAFHRPEVVQAWVDDGLISLEEGIWKHARLTNTPTGPQWRVPCAIGNRGKLAKLPRLDNGSREKAMGLLEEASVLLEPALLQVVRDADMVDEWMATGHQGPASITGRTAGLTPAVMNEQVRPESVLNSAGRQGSEKVSCIHTGCVSQDHPDALVRSHAAAFALARILGQPPTLEELESFYVENGYATGPATASRRTRLRDVVKFVSSVWDPDLSRLGFQARLDALMVAVQAHVQPEHREDVCYDRHVADRELAFLLYVVERGTFDRTQSAERIWTLPSQSVQAFAGRLKSDGVEIGGWSNRNKFTSAKQILERAGLIHRFDHLFLAKGPVHGVGMRYHIGPNHPMYLNFVGFCRAQPPTVRRVNHSRVAVLRPFDGATTEAMAFVPAQIRISAAA